MLQSSVQIHMVISSKFVIMHIFGFYIIYNILNAYIYFIDLRKNQINWNGMNF
mgnify:CR=1 FL=1